MITTMCERYPAFGYRKIGAMLRREGNVSNHKQLYRYKDHKRGTGHYSRGRLRYVSTVWPAAFESRSVSPRTSYEAASIRSSR